METEDDSASDFVAATQGRLQSDELTTVHVFQANAPSVVYIANLVVKQDGLMEMQRSGSGFVWNKRGHIVTNFHVIHGSSVLRITLADQSTYDAGVVDYDQDNDIAVLRVEAPKEKLRQLRPILIGVSTNLLVGQNVYAIGYPFGLGLSLTTGVISGLHRTIGRPPIHDVIQTDASINAGNSGGPLVDSSGNVIGIITAIWSRYRSHFRESCGTAFAIPIATVAGIVKKVTTPKPLVEWGKVTTPSLESHSAPDQSVKQLGVSGVLIEDAPANSPASKAVGLRSSGPRNASRKCASLKRRTSQLQINKGKDKEVKGRETAEIRKEQRKVLSEEQRKVSVRNRRISEEQRKVSARNRRISESIRKEQKNQGGAKKEQRSISVRSRKTELITKDSISIQIRLNLMFQIIKASAQNDNALVAQLSRSLRDLFNQVGLHEKAFFMDMVCWKTRELKIKD